MKKSTSAREGERQVSRAFDHTRRRRERASMSSTAARFMLGPRAPRCAAGAGLDAEDAFLEQDGLQGPLHVLASSVVHVVGDDQNLDAHLEQAGRGSPDDRVLARPTGPPDARSAWIFFAKFRHSFSS